VVFDARGVPPEDPYPAGLDYAVTVLAWAADHGANLGIDITLLAVAVATQEQR
jgi:acetyl esterase/lipase